MAQRKAISVNELYKALEKEIKRGNGNKGILVGMDDEGNGFRPMFYLISPTEGNVDMATLYGVSYEDAIKNYLIIG